MRKQIPWMIVLTTLFSVNVAHGQTKRTREDLRSLATAWETALSGQQSDPGRQRQPVRQAYADNRPVQKVWAEDGSFSVELPVDYDTASNSPGLFVAQSKRGEGFYFIKSEHVTPEELGGVGSIPDLLSPALQASASPYYSPVDVIRIMLPQTRLPEGSITDVRVLRADPFDAPRTAGFGPASEIAVVHFQCSVASSRIQGAAVVQTTPPVVMGVWYLTMAMVAAPVELFKSNWPTYQRIMVSLSSGEGRPLTPVLTTPPGLSKSTPSSGSGAQSPYPTGMGRRTDTLGGQIVFRDPQDPNYAATHSLVGVPSNASWWRCNEESGVTLWTGSGSPGISCRQVFPRN